MALNVFAFCAIFFMIIALALTGALGYVQIAKKKPQLGNLVRTTFTGNPAVLTTALWGIASYTSPQSFANSITYGEGFDHDSINSLHCDVYEGYGTVSTWVSDGGINFKNSQKYGFLQSASTLYFNNRTCQTHSDCSVTDIPCGPTEPQWNAGPVVNGVRNPAALQCPSGLQSNSVYCNVCEGPPTGQAGYCASISTGAQGFCVNTSNDNPLNCVQVSSRSSNKYCLAFKPVNNSNSVPFDRLTSCSVVSPNDNVGTRGVPGSGVCANSLPGNWFCENTDPAGNIMCGLGQTCELNLNSSSGWCPPGGGCANLQTATRVCMGDIAPNVTINMPWIAEGKVISTNGTTSVVQWERVQNTYLGIGPSPKIFSSVSETRAQAVSDMSWVYSDCRFIDNGSSGRQAAVALAILGTSVTNPSWDSLVDPARNSTAENLLYIGTSTGSIAKTIAEQKTPYYRSAWHLRSTDVPNSQLERIWFYSIFPMEGIPDHPVSKVKAAVQVNFGNADLDAMIALHGQ